MDEDLLDEVADAGGKDDEGDTCGVGPGEQEVGGVPELAVGGLDHPGEPGRPHSRLLEEQVRLGVPLQRGVRRCGVEGCTCGEGEVQW